MDNCKKLARVDREASILNLIWCEDWHYNTRLYIYSYISWYWFIHIYFKKKFEKYGVEEFVYCKWHRKYRTIVLIYLQMDKLEISGRRKSRFCLKKIEWVCTNKIRDFLNLPPKNYQFYRFSPRILEIFTIYPSANQYLREISCSEPLEKFLEGMSGVPLPHPPPRHILSKFVAPDIGWFWILAKLNQLFFF